MRFKKQVNDFDFGIGIGFGFDSDCEKVLPFLFLIVSLLRFAFASVVVVVSVSWLACGGDSGVCSGAQFCTLLAVEHQTVVTRSIST